MFCIHAPFEPIGLSYDDGPPNDETTCADGGPSSIGFPSSPTAFSYGHDCHQCGARCCNEDNGCATASGAVIDCDCFGYVPPPASPPPPSEPPLSPPPAPPTSPPRFPVQHSQITCDDLRGRVNIDTVSGLGCHKINHPTSHQQYAGLSCTDYYYYLTTTDPANPKNNAWQAWPGMYTICIEVTDSDNRRCQAANKKISQSGLAAEDSTAENNAGVVQCIDPPSPPALPRPPATPPATPPPAPPPDATGCDEFKRRWDASIARARDDYNANPSYPYGNIELHTHAFSRQCWQYSHSGGSAGVTDPWNSCEERIEQKGYTGNWWAYTWNDANSGSFRFDGPNGAATTSLDTWEISGWFSLCKWLSDGTTCAPANNAAVGSDYYVYLEPSHPSYFTPNQEATPAQSHPLDLSPPITDAAICPAQGTYSPVLTFPPNGNQPASVENRLIATPAVVITPTSPPPPPVPPLPPPPPTSPPSPPNPPPPPTYNVEIVVNNPVSSAAACLQTAGSAVHREDVETAQECSDAMSQVGFPVSSIHDTTGEYSNGYRCHSNASSVFVWAVPPFPSASRPYMCRYGGPPASNRRKLAFRGPVSRLSSWVDSGGYLYSSQLHAANATYNNFLRMVNVTGHPEFSRTDVAFIHHSLCGMICIVDDLIETWVYYGTERCMRLSEAMAFFLDDDRC